MGQSCIAIANLSHMSSACVDITHKQVDISSPAEWATHAAILCETEIEQICLFLREFLTMFHLNIHVSLETLWTPLNLLTLTTTSPIAFYSKTEAIENSNIICAESPLWRCLLSTWGCSVINIKTVNSAYRSVFPHNIIRNDWP